MSVGAYWCLRVRTVVYGCLLESEGDYWCLRILLLPIGV